MNTAGLFVYESPLPAYWTDLSALPSWRLFCYATDANGHAPVTRDDERVAAQSLLELSTRPRILSVPVSGK